MAQAMAQIDSVRWKIYSIHNQIIESITPREKQVLHQLSNGLTTQEIGAILMISEHTVMTHRKSLLHKMDARNVAALIRKGFEYGFLKC